MNLSTVISVCSKWRMIFKIFCLKNYWISSSARKPLANLLLQDRAQYQRHKYERQCAIENLPVTLCLLLIRGNVEDIANILSYTVLLFPTSVQHNTISVSIQFCFGTFSASASASAQLCVIGNKWWEKFEKSKTQIDTTTTTSSIFVNVVFYFLSFKIDCRLFLSNTNILLHPNRGYSLVLLSPNKFTIFLIYLNTISLGICWPLFRQSYANITT